MSEYQIEHAPGASLLSAGWRAALLFNILWVALVQCAGAQAQDPGSIPVKQLASDAAANEVKLIQYGADYLRYQVHTRDAKGDQLRDVIESRDGTVARIVRRGDRPLTAEEDASEHARLQDMLDSPDAFHKHVQKDQTGKKMAVDLLKLLPEAMIFSYAPGQPQRGDRPADQPKELVVDFRPDPKWSPPTMIAEALTGIEGRCWIDLKTRHLVRLEADLFQGINFGFGFFAHIYPGGTFVVEQVPVGGGRWIVAHFTEHVTLRAMMVKTLKEDTELMASNFSVVPPMDYQQAIRELLSK